MFAGLLGNPSDDVVLQVTTLFVIPALIVCTMLLLRNIQLRLRLKQLRAVLDASAKIRAEAAAL